MSVAVITSCWNAQLQRPAWEVVYERDHLCCISTYSCQEDAKRFAVAMDCEAIIENERPMRVSGGQAA